MYKTCDRWWWLCTKSCFCFLFLKYSTLEEKEAKYPFPTELWNAAQWTCDNNIPRKTNSVEGLHNTVQSSVINRHPNIWKVYLNEGRHFSEKRKCMVLNKEKDQQAKKQNKTKQNKKKNKKPDIKYYENRPGRQVFWYKPINLFWEVLPWVYTYFKGIQVFCILQ